MKNESAPIRFQAVDLIATLNRDERAFAEAMGRLIEHRAKISRISDFTDFDEDEHVRIDKQLQKEAGKSRRALRTINASSERIVEIHGAVVELYKDKGRFNNF